MDDEILHFMKQRLDKDYYEKFSFAFNSGKRIRPRLMKNVCIHIGKDFRPLLPAAAAVEVMHCMSLAHDDIVDEANMRRNKTSFYKKYGTNSAVLFGDLFAITAIEIIAENYAKEIYLEFLKTFREMVEGQIMEIENKVNGVDSYFTYAEKKTASLFVLSAKIPLMHYGIKDDKILEFTKEFGLLFQIANDVAGKGNKELSILNFISNEEARNTISDKEDHLRKIYMRSMDGILEILDGF